jgi:hypothetical protein
MIDDFRPFSTSLSSPYFFLIPRRVKIFCLIIKHKTNKTRIHLISKSKTITDINILFNKRSTLTQCSLRRLKIHLGAKLLLMTIKTFSILKLIIIHLLLTSKIVALKGVYSILTNLSWFLLLGKKFFEILLFEIFRWWARKYGCR